MMALICYDGSADEDDGTDAALQKAALETATDGAQRATAAGFVSETRVVNRDDDIAADILAVADDVDANVIVLGTRGLGPVKSLMLGSVLDALLHHADRPVVVVSAPALAERRHRWAEHAQLPAGVT